MIPPFRSIAATANHLLFYSSTVNPEQGDYQGSIKEQSCEAQGLSAYDARWRSELAATLDLFVRSSLEIVCQFASMLFRLRENA